MHEPAQRGLARARRRRGEGGGLGEAPVAGREGGRGVVAVQPHGPGQLEGHSRVDALRRGQVQDRLDRRTRHDPEAGQHRVDVDALLGPHRPDRAQRVALETAPVDAVADHGHGQHQGAAHVLAHLLGVDGQEVRDLGAHVGQRRLGHLLDGELLQQAGDDLQHGWVHEWLLVHRDNPGGPSLSHRRGPGEPCDGILDDGASPGPRTGQRSRVPAPGGGGHRPGAPAPRPGRRPLTLSTAHGCIESGGPGYTSSSARARVERRDRDRAC